MIAGDGVLHRVRDAKSCSVLVKIGPGEHYVTAKPGEVLTTVLGSCVAACIRDPFAGVGGMNHFMLPDSETGAWGKDIRSLRFGNFAMERMVNDILKRGGRRELLEAKLFGGGDMLCNGARVGELNAGFAEEYLRAEGIRLAAHQLRGHAARRVKYDPLSGRAMVLEMPMLSQREITRREAAYRAAMAQAMPSGDVELFDPAYGPLATR